jgi:hypothetical protein
MTSIKNMIDNPPPLETFDDDEDEEHPFWTNKRR